MAMVINSNIASLTSQRHLSQSRNEMEVAMERMSSGSRINSSMDDAAGLAIGNRMTSQIEGLNQAIRNANDGISLAQTAESALDSHSGILQRMRVLAVQAANDTYSTLDRKTLNNEIVQLKEELNRSVSQAAFNGQKILDGSNATFTFQIGHTAKDTVTVALSNMSGSNIGMQGWASKAGVTAPTTTTAVIGAVAPGTIAGAAAGTAGTTGFAAVAVQATIAAVPATMDLTITGAAIINDSVSITVGATTFTHTFTANKATATLASADFAAAWTLDAAANAVYTVASAAGVLTFTEVTPSAGALTGSAAYIPTTGGTIAGNTTGTSRTTGALLVPAVTLVVPVPATLTLAISAAVTAGDIASVTVGSTTFAHTFTSDAASATLTADAYVAAWNADSTASAMYSAVNGSGTITFTQVTATDGALSGSADYTKVGIQAEQESYDFSGITLAVGDRISLNIPTTAAVVAVKEVDTITLAAGVTAAGGSVSFAYGGATYTKAFDTDAATTITGLVGAINAGTAGSTVTAAAVDGTHFTITAKAGSGTQMTKGTISGTTGAAGPVNLSITTADTTTGKAAIAAGPIATYTQEFTTDQATTLSALGALVVNGESDYQSKTVSSGKLVFTGAAVGTAMDAAIIKVETGSISAANSIDDVIITDSASAKHALTVVDNALEMMAEFRSRMGAASNRMFHTIDNLMSVSENTSAARSRIIDADFAAESANLAKSQILQKAGTAMLSQANASTQDVLSLLK